MEVVFPDRYTPRCRLGAGTQGEVFLVQDGLLGLPVALKVLHPAAPDPLARREVAALLALEFPGVVKLYDAGTLRLRDGRTSSYLAMEHLQGPSFPALGRWDWADLIGPVTALLRGLRQVHAAGVVHRDLKPEHIRLEGPRVVLLDFGAASGHGADARGPCADAGAGTRRYMAPEQHLDAETVGPAADLYAVGVLLYEALAGVPPHDLAFLPGSRLRAEERPIGTLRPDLPGVVRTLVAGLLARFPEDRIPTAEAALATLEAGADVEVARLRALVRVSDNGAWRPVFALPERVFGWRSWANEVLVQRVGGRLEDVPVEVAAWIAAGRARVEDGAVVLTRADLGWLAEGIPLRDGEGGEGGGGSSALLAAARITEAPRDRWVQARELFQAGDADGAVRILEHGLRAARRQNLPDVEADILCLQTAVSCGIASPGALRRARYEVVRSGAPACVTAPLLRLMDGGSCARAGATGPALALLEGLPAFADELLDRWRIGFEVEAAQHGDHARMEQALARAEAWARMRGTRTAAADLAGWEGIAAYRQGRFAEAARLLARAVAGKGTVSGRLSAMGTLAAALLEDGQFEAADDTAAALIQAALVARIPTQAAVGEWVRRSVGYRRGISQAPDQELVEAVAGLGQDTRRAQVCFTEAAVAWRNGDVGTAERHASVAAAIWRPTGGASWVLAAALVACCKLRTEAEPPLEALALAEQAAQELKGSAPGVALQALGLLLHTWPALAPRWGDEGRAALDGLPVALTLGTRELLDPRTIFSITDATLAP